MLALLYVRLSVADRIAGPLVLTQHPCPQAPPIATVLESPKKIRNTEEAGHFTRGFRAPGEMPQTNDDFAAQEAAAAYALLRCYDASGISKDSRMIIPLL